MKNFSIVARISENTALDPADIPFVERKLKETSQSTFIRQCINTQRLYEEGELIRAGEINKKLEEFKQQILQLIQSGEIVVKNAAATGDINITGNDDNGSNKDNKGSNEWFSNEDFLAMLDSITDF